MKKSVRILCLIIALLFIVGALLMVYLTAAYALAAGEKSETVYVTADAGGGVKSMLSSVYISNPGKLAAIFDRSALTGIETVGDTQPPKLENGVYTFQANGEDVAYQGTAAGQLPVTMTVGYTLNGSPVEPGKLAGGTGHLVITVRFTNHSMQNAAVDGETVPLYTPFTAVTILTLNDTCTNVTCENARIMSGTGDTTVTAFNFPGLAYDLDTDATGKLAESFSVEADVADFTFGGIKAVILTGLVDTDDLSELDDFDQLTFGIDDLSEAGNKLADATDSLYSGAKDLQDGISGYRDGAKKLSSGMQEAVAGNAKTIDGVSSLQSGIGDLRTGLYSLSSSLNNISASSGSSMDAAALQQQLAALGLTPEQMAGVGAIVEQTATAAAQQTANTIASNLKTGLTQLEQGADQLQSGAASLGAGMRQAGDGLVELGKGTADLAEQGDTLADGAGSLAKGIKKLRGGVGDLNEEGIQKLADDTGGLRVGLSRRDAVVRLGKAYQSFSGLPEGMTGSVRFVIDTEELAVPKPFAAETGSSVAESGAPDGQDGRETERQGFFAAIWSWIKHLFGG